jgi:hypothetical protein
MLSALFSDLTARGLYPKGLAECTRDRDPRRPRRRGSRGPPGDAPRQRVAQYGRHVRHGLPVVRRVDGGLRSSHRRGRHRTAPRRPLSARAPRGGQRGRHRPQPAPRLAAVLRLGRRATGRRLALANGTHEIAPDAARPATRCSPWASCAVLAACAGKGMEDRRDSGIAVRACARSRDRWRRSSRSTARPGCDAMDADRRR